MANIYERKGSPYFWIKYRTESGKIRQESTRFRIGIGPEARAARQLEAERTLEELKRGKTKRHENWEWVDQFFAVRYAANPVSLERYRSSWSTLKMFLDEKGIESVAHLRREHCFAYVEWRKSADKRNGKYKACQNTAILELKTLRLIAQEAVLRGLIQGNPCVKLGIKRESPKVKPELTAEDVAKIREEIPKWKNEEHRKMFGVSFEIARYQGCRLSETRINPQTDVTIVGDSGLIRFHAKGGKEFATMLHPALAPLFQRLKSEGRTTTWDIPKGRGRQWAASAWWKFLRSIGLKAKGITFHSTRVTVVTEMARNDIHESKAQAYVGHASTTVHRIYQRLRPADLTSVVSAVGGGDKCP